MKKTVPADSGKVIIIPRPPVAGLSEEESTPVASAPQECASYVSQDQPAATAPATPSAPAAPSASIAPPAAPAGPSAPAQGGGSR